MHWLNCWNLQNHSEIGKHLRKRNQNHLAIVMLMEKYLNLVIKINLQKLTLMEIHWNLGIGKLNYLRKLSWMKMQC